VIEQLAAKTGGGNANVTGVIYLKDLRPEKFYLDSTVNNVSVSDKGLDATLDGNLAVRGDGSGQTIAGEIFVKRASYNKNVDWKAFILRKRAALPPSPKSFLATTGLNIRVYGSNRIMVKNNVIRAPLSADLTIRGTLANPIPLGRVQAASGKVYFRNTEFTIEHASVIFSDQNRIDPSMDVMASTTIKGYEIDVSAAGTLDHMTLSFSSQPHLEQMDILSLLTTGNFGGASPGIEGGVGASEASSFLTGQFESVITKRIKSITGFDRFQIDPYVSTTTGTVTPRITVSKRLLGDRLFVIYSAPIGTEEQIIRLEYAITRSVSLIGTRDDTGDMGGDIKYQFKFR
jgi:translocation and assembly module TamB